MRLYLTSYRLGDRPTDLIELVGTNARAAVIANAGDAWSGDGRAAQVQREIDDLGGLGMRAEDLDLRNWFGRGNELREELRRFDVVWVKGGNTFVLRRAFALSGFDDAIRDALATDAIVYAGYSAGSCVATPTLRGIAPMDEPNATPRGYGDDVLWDGLGLVPFQIVPHYDSDHPESHMASTCIEQLIATHEPFIALRDGETLIVSGHERRVTARA